MNDNQLREQLNTLSSLSGGIVYGKEEAWDKLQVRLDKKVTRKITVRVWASAAAILLLITCIAPLFFRNEIRVAKTNTPLAASAIAGKTDYTPHAQPIQDMSAQPKTMTTLPNLTRRRTAPIQPAMQVELPDEPAAVSQPVNDNSIARNNAANIALTPPPLMDVVHINDIEGRQPQQAGGRQAIAQQEQVNDIRTMPVLHINDVMREAYEVKVLLRENRFSFGRAIFSRSAYDNIDINPDSNAEEADQSHHLLKNIFNLQN